MDKPASFASVESERSVVRAASVQTIFGKCAKWTLRLRLDNACSTAYFAMNYKQRRLAIRDLLERIEPKASGPQILIPNFALRLFFGDELTASTERVPLNETCMSGATANNALVSLRPRSSATLAGVRPVRYAYAAI